MTFTPVEPEMEAGSAQVLLLVSLTAEVHGNATLVGKQQHIAQWGHLCEELIDTGTSDVQELVYRLAMLL